MGITPIFDMLWYSTRFCVWYSCSTRGIATIVAWGVKEFVVLSLDVFVPGHVRCLVISIVNVADWSMLRDDVPLLSLARDHK